MKSHQPKASNKYVAKSKWLSLALASLLCVASAVLAKPPQTGLQFVVNTTGDADGVGSGGLCDTDDATPGEQCTLRAAIQAANMNVGEDEIVFSIPASDPGCAAATGRCTIKLTKALPDLESDMAITGPGANKLTVQRNSNTLFRIFNVTTTGAVTFSGMTISNGYARGALHGGGILNDRTGTVNVQSCHITSNEAKEGGGIGNFGGGTVNVSHSLLSYNIASGTPSSCCIRSGGGGIANEYGGTVNVINSTIAGNFAFGNNVITAPSAPGLGQGGGVYNSTGTVNITNSTIASNETNGPDAEASGGGGVFNDSGAVNLKSTIVADNSAVGSGQDIFGPVTSHGFNFVEDPSGSSVVQQPTDIFGGDPMLDTLIDRGGPTHTMALLVGSPAIDKGTSDGLTGALTTDQRGFARTVDNPAVENAPGSDGTDIGAFEMRQEVRFSNFAYSVGEGEGSITITVELTIPLNDTATVYFTTSNGTAVAGRDYTAKSGTLTFAAGQLSATFSVPITDDTLNETDETVKLTLSNPTGGPFLGVPSAATLKIVSDDPPPTISINNAAVTEGNSGTLPAYFTITLSAASGQTVTVNMKTADGTAKAAGDYWARAVTISFLPGQTSKTIGVLVRGDVSDENNETFFVNLSSPVNATLADSQGRGTITDNDPPPSLRINNVSVTEVDAGTSIASLTVTLSIVSERNVTVNMATADGTAKAPGDYSARTVTLYFFPGQKTKVVGFKVSGDTLKETNETFFVNLSGALNATIADAQGQVTIINDD